MTEEPSKIPVETPRSKSPSTRLKSIQTRIHAGRVFELPASLPAYFHVLPGAVLASFRLQGCPGLAVELVEVTGIRRLLDVHQGSRRQRIPVAKVIPRNLSISTSAHRHRGLDDTLLGWQKQG